MDKIQELLWSGSEETYFSTMQYSIKERMGYL